MMLRGDAGDTMNECFSSAFPVHLKDVCSNSDTCAMTFDHIVRHVGSVPHMTPERGRLLYDFLRRSQPDNVLELGFAHGTSSCYIAAAMQENGTGRLLTIDHERARARNPNIFSLLEKTKLGSFVEPVFCPRTYTWELMRLLDEQTKEGRTEPLFDFVFIDGGHTWDSDGFAFMLVDRLLKPGGWVLFDDVLWTPAQSKGEPWVDELTEEERNTAHIDKVFKLLVIPHGGYHDFQFDGTWAWARKKPDTGNEHRAIDKETLEAIYRTTRSVRRLNLMRRYLRKLFRLS